MRRVICLRCHMNNLRSVNNSRLVLSLWDTMHTSRVHKAKPNMKEKYGVSRKNWACLVLPMFSQILYHMIKICVPKSNLLLCTPSLIFYGYRLKKHMLPNFHNKSCVLIRPLISSNIYIYIRVLLDAPASNLQLRPPNKEVIKTPWGC
jgi:hypothetical protein